MTDNIIMIMTGYYNFRLIFKNVTELTKYILAKVLLLVGFG